jgi:hypothetical protein
VALRVVRGQEPEAEPPAFAFPEDQGGKLLADLLPPPHRDPPRSMKGSPRSRHAAPPRALEHPELAPALGLPPLPRARVGPGPAMSRPRPLLDEALPIETGLRALPEQPNVSGGPGIRLPSPDVSEPIPLPLFAQPQPDRAPLEDPSTEASTAAALAEGPPARSTPVPFLRLSLPDPFEHRAAVRLPAALSAGRDRGTRGDELRSGPVPHAFAARGRPGRPVAEGPRKHGTRRSHTSFLS